MKKRRIAFLVSHPIQYLSPFFKKLAGHPGIDLTVIYCSDESAGGLYDREFRVKLKWDIPMLEGYDHKFLKNYSPRPTFYKAPSGLINIGIIGELWNNRYDAVIIHGWHYVTFWLAYLAAFYLKIPVFLHSENPYNQEIKKARPKILIKKIVLGSLFKHIAGFLAIGTENRRFYEFYGVKDDKIFFTPYAVDNARFISERNSNLSKKGEFRKEMGIQDAGTVIMFSGKLITKKRPMDLLRAYEVVDSPDKALVFVGAGQLRNEMERYIAERKIKNVTFTGFKNQTELYRYYIAADIFVLPSTFGETWGVVVNEAMCFGLPVIVSDLVGCGGDLVKHGENGYIFDTGDIITLARYLKILIDDKDARERFGRSSLNIISTWNYEKDIEGVVDAISGRRGCDDR